MQDSRLLTSAEAAALLRCSPSMVRKMVAAGDLPATRIGTAIRIPATAVEARLSPVAEARPSTAAADAIVRVFVGLDARLAAMQREIADLRREVLSE